MKELYCYKHWAIKHAAKYPISNHQHSRLRAAFSLP